MNAQDPSQMQFFSHDGFDLAFLDRQPASGQGDPVLMIHGFASTHYVNWVSPGWFKALNDAGYRAIAFDNRGHGASSKSYQEADYTPAKMASDGAALLNHLGIERAHVMGYSMGARISAFLALSDPDKVATLVFGGLGVGMVDGVGDWDPIAAALLADDPDSTSHPRGRSFRAFAD
ncbi:MAG: alpha/beta hydrolase, partial [Mesorhizobium sp.]